MTNTTMKWLQRAPLTLAAGLYLAALAFPQVAKKQPINPPSESCDPALATHVYNPQRLRVIEQCISLQGIIVDATAGRRKDGQRHEKDGDNHGWVKPDKDFAWTLIAGNKENQGDNLVFECVCQYPVTQTDAIAACKGFKSKVVIPPVGSHVLITGVLVEDLDHHPIHRELHPVTSILLIPTQ